MLDQVQHDLVFVGHSGLDPESIGLRRFTGGEVRRMMDFDVPDGSTGSP
ncbi:hypothetical protein [Inquilinus sp. CAU 1745]